MQVPSGNALHTIAGGAAAKPDPRPSPAASDAVRQARPVSADAGLPVQNAPKAGPPAEAASAQPYYPAPRGTHLDIIV